MVRGENPVLKYHDEAVLRDSNNSEDPEKNISDKAMLECLYAFLNNFTKNNGEKVLPGELDKGEDSSKEKKIVETVLSAVTEQMISLERNKIINVTLPFIHLVPEGFVHKSDSVFGGIVVERTADDVIFAIKLFQKVFERMSYSAVKVLDDRQIAYIDVGNSFKEAVASFQSREFLKEVIENPLFEKKEEIVEEKLFNLGAEKVFNDELDNLWERNEKIFPREKLFQNMVEATINGRIVPMMVLRDRIVDLNDAQRCFR